MGRNSLNFDHSISHVELDPSFPLRVIRHKVSSDEITDLHRHDSFEVGICHEGYGIWMLDGRIKTYKAGDIVAAGPDIFHRAHTDSSDRDSWSFLSFDASFFSPVELDTSLSLLMSGSDDMLLHDTVKAIADEWFSEKSDSRKLIYGWMSAMIPMLAHEASIRKDSGGKSGISENMDSRVMKVINFMINGIGTETPVSALAEEANMSLSYFRDLFGKEVGMSPKEFQIMLRLERSLNLLRNTDLRMIDIAAECGFSSITSFNKQFSRRYKMTPGQMRKEKY